MNKKRKLKTDIANHDDKVLISDNTSNFALDDSIPSQSRSSTSTTGQVGARSRPLFRKRDVSSNNIPKITDSDTKGNPNSVATIDCCETESVQEFFTSNDKPKRDIVVAKCKLDDDRDADDFVDAPRKLHKNQSNQSRSLLTRNRKEIKNELFRLPTPIQEKFAPSPSKYNFEPLSSSQPLSEDKDKCPGDPSCSAIVPTPYSAALQEALDYLRLCETQHERGLMGRDKVLFARNKVCRIHLAEQEIIPRGLAAGYRNDICFLKEVPDRVRRLRRDLVRIIKGKMESTYRKDVLKKIKRSGYWSSQSTATKLHQIETFKCGYYGWQGANAILAVLQDMFKGNDSPLTKERTAPQNTFDYLQTVLVPETVTRLIAQDQNLDIHSLSDLEMARTIMKESSDFGDALYGNLSAS